MPDIRWRLGLAHRPVGGISLADKQASNLLACGACIHEINASASTSPVPRADNWRGQRTRPRC
jgi:hypothetical protein